MRIGEILIGSQLIDAKALEEALDYAAGKSVPVGRALRTLKYISETDLTRGLDAQVAIRKGLNGQLAVSVLRFSYQTNRSFLEALKAWPGAVGKDAIPQSVIDALSEKSLEETKVRPKPNVQQQSGTFTQEEIVARIQQRNASLSQLEAHIYGKKPEAAKKAQPGMPIDAPQQEQSADVLIAEGDKLFAANKLIPAEKSYQMALRQLEDAYGTPPSKISAILTKMANLYVATERSVEAEPYYKRVLEIQTKIFGPNSPEVAQVVENLGDLKHHQGKMMEAESLFEQGLAIVQQQKFLDLLIAGRLLKKIATTHVGRPNQRTRLGELAVDANFISAEKLQTALQKSHGTGALLGMVLRMENLLDAQQVESLMLAQLLIKQGTITSGVAIAALKVANSQKVPLRQICDGGKWVADLEGGDERYQALVVEQERLLAAENSLGADHPEVLTIVQKIAELHLARKDRLSAEVFFKRAIAGLERGKEQDRIAVARVCEKLAQTYCQQGKYGEAQPLLLKSLEQRQAAGFGESIETAKCLWLVAKIELAQYNHATALSFLRSARNMFDKLAPGKCPKQLLEEMSTCCAETGANTELEDILQKLIQDQESNAVEAKKADFMQQLADLYVSTGKREEARALYSSSLEIYVRNASGQDKTQAVSKKLAQIT
jgi:tetratricopeptide (TPR) repeat protein